MHALIQLRRPLGWAALGAIALLATTVAAPLADSRTARARVALVPLDDRSPNLQMPVMLGAVADAEVLTPPRGVLGRDLKTGDGVAVAQWLDGLDLSTFDAVIVSTDMLAYGGLAGSRVPRVFEAEARQRLAALERLKQRRADLRIYAFGTMPPPAAEGHSDAVRQARVRNLAINGVLTEKAASGAIDHLAFGQDSARDSGADHLAMLLLTRALMARVAYTPVVQVVYSSTNAREVGAAVASQVAAAGGRVADRADLQVFVYTSRNESPDQADALVTRVAQAVTSGRRVVVADIDPGGGAGSWLPLVEGLRARKLLPRLYGYAASTSVESTLGAALAQGLLFALAVDKIAPPSPDVGVRVASAQVRLLLFRLVTDFLYEGVVRRQATEDFLRPRGMNPRRLDESGRLRVERHLAGELKPLAESLTADFTAQPWRLPDPAGRRSRVGLTVKDIEGFTITLPWNRMSEPEIGFTLSATPLGAQPRPPAPRVLQ